MMRIRPLQLFRWMLAVSAVLMGTQVHGVASAAEPPADGSLSLIITYHTAPANRPALHRELAQSVVREVQRWKRDGRIKRYRVLFNRYADSDNWDAMALLTFATSSDLYRWRTIEQTTPAALSRKGLALTTAIHTAPVDLIRTDSAADTSQNAVYVVIPYKTLVSPSDYVNYADGYVIPQFKGWMEEGVLSRYALYTSSFPAGRPWTAMVILQYKDEAALSARDAVVAKVRERLKHNPEWKAISDSKKSVRTEEQVVIADPVAVN
ncbi:hypothetical protein PTE30175_03220 [Pandoraea terrae]|uniref:NIPSNAP family containing protein n=2 Tax=Pandoraea terrae TaxID=1537710 RepID=A0A5E4WJJ9_9BURK|nr:hypothetical protein PTE30175_03220 [Pandoraea terrae]